MYVHIGYFRVGVCLGGGGLNRSHKRESSSRVPGTCSLGEFSKSRHVFWKWLEMHLEWTSSGTLTRRPIIKGLKLKATWGIIMSSRNGQKCI